MAGSQKKFRKALPANFFDESGKSQKRPPNLSGPSARSIGSGRVILGLLGVRLALQEKTKISVFGVILLYFVVMLRLPPSIVSHK